MKLNEALLLKFVFVGSPCLKENNTVVSVPIYPRNLRQKGFGNPLHIFFKGCWKLRIYSGKKFGISRCEFQRFQFTIYGCSLFYNIYARLSFEYSAWNECLEMTSLRIIFYLQDEGSKPFVRRLIVFGDNVLFFSIVYLLFRKTASRIPLNFDVPLYPESYFSFKQAQTASILCRNSCQNFVVFILCIMNPGCPWI